MCRLTLWERYIQCGCVINVGFKYQPEWCKTPNGIPFEKPELFDERYRIPGRCCDEDKWTYSYLDIPGICMDCRHKFIVRRSGLGEVMNRLKFRCGHTIDWFYRARLHCAFRFDIEKVLKEEEMLNGDEEKKEDGAVQENSINSLPKNDKGQLMMPPCWYTYVPGSRRGYCVATEEHLELWHRVKVGWALDFDQLRASGKVRCFVRKRGCGNCVREANLDLYDSLMMSPEDDTRGYRKRKPYALDISIERAKTFPENFSDAVAVRENENN